MKRWDDNQKLSESKKYISGFNGYVLENIPRIDLKQIQYVLDEEDVPYDVLKDRNYYVIVTDIESTHPEALAEWKEIVKEIERCTGYREHNFKMNK